MLKAKVTVLIPIGKHAVYREYLPEAIQSVFSQTVLPDEILLIDDGANITDQDMHNWFGDRLCFSKLRKQETIWWLGGTTITKWKSPFPNGFISAFNNGVALAKNDLIVYLAADDRLEPDAIKDCVETWEENNQKDAWYAMTYSDAGRVDDTPINAAMICRNLFNYLGGYPPAAFAGPDAALLSIMMIHLPDRIIRVKPGKVNYTICKHDWQETKVTAQVYSDEMTSIRNKLTLNFKPVNGVVLK